MKILAIETSCDDTGIAIIETPEKERGCFNILSNIVSSQVEIHKKWGGVYPTLAKREHQKNLVPVLVEALKKAKLLETQNAKSKTQISRSAPCNCFAIKQNYNLKIKTLNKILEREKDLQKKLISFLEKYQKPDIDLIAITIGPGLEPCLWVGINFAKALAYYWNLPVMPVNHIEAHILVNFIKHETYNMKQLFPAVCLVVSGGHTQLILMENFNKYKVIGETRDDAAGECFDKTARILGLGYPGGPAIAAEAAKLQITNYKLQTKLPRPMINTKDYDFSFSGLKTAVLYQVQNTKVKSQKYVRAMAAEIQQSVIDVLIKKTIKAVKDYKAKTIILGGGVTANEELRKQFKERIKKSIPDTKYLIPDTKYCTDNALMVAIAACFKPINKKNECWQNIKADSNLKI